MTSLAETKTLTTSKQGQPTGRNPERKKKMNSQINSEADLNEMADLNAFAAAAQLADEAALSTLSVQDAA